MSSICICSVVVSLFHPVLLRESLRYVCVALFVQCAVSSHWGRGALELLLHILGVFVSVCEWKQQGA